MLTAEQIAILNAEINDDPEGKGYAALLPNQPGHVVNLLNDLTETKVGLLDRTNLTLWAVGTNMLGTIEDEAADKTSDLRSSALAILYVLKGASSGIDFAKPENLQILDLWESKLKLTAAHRAAMLAMAVHPASRAGVLGLPYITEEMLRNR